ncbi:MAG: hypothetical protein ACREC1_10130 [Methylovirgula sp.]
MFGRLVLALALCGLCGVAYAGDAGASPPSPALDPPPPASPNLSLGSDKLGGGHSTGNAAQNAKVPSADAEIGNVHMSLHIMGGAAAGGVIRP